MLWFIIYQTISISFHIDGFFMFIKVQKYKIFYIPLPSHRHFQPNKPPSPSPVRSNFAIFYTFPMEKLGNFYTFPIQNRAISYTFPMEKPGNFYTFPIQNRVIFYTFPTSNHPSRRQFQPVPYEQGDEKHTAIHIEDSQVFTAKMGHRVGSH